MLGGNKMKTLLTILLFANFTLFAQNTQLGYEESIKLLLKSQKNENIRILEIQRLLQMGGDVNAVDPTTGETPLMLAAEAGDLPLVKLLLEEGADVNMERFYRFTALHLAAGNGHTSVVRVLVDVPGINLDIPSMRGDTPLIEAAASGYTNIVQVLVDAGANVNFNYQKSARAYFAGQTPLMIAAEHGLTDIVKILLDVPTIELNLVNNEGLNALMLAARNEHSEIVEMIIQAGLQQ